MSSHVKGTGIYYGSPTTGFPPLHQYQKPPSDYSEEASTPRTTFSMPGTAISSVPSSSDGNAPYYITVEGYADPDTSSPRTLSKKEKKAQKDYEKHLQAAKADEEQQQQLKQQKQQQEYKARLQEQVRIEKLKAKQEKKWLKEKAQQAQQAHNYQKQHYLHPQTQAVAPPTVTYSPESPVQYSDLIHCQPSYPPQTYPTQPYPVSTTYPTAPTQPPKTSKKSVPPKWLQVAAGVKVVPNRSKTKNKLSHVHEWVGDQYDYEHGDDGRRWQ